MPYFCTSGKIISANKGEGNIQKRIRVERAERNKKIEIVIAIIEYTQIAKRLKDKRCPLTVLMLSLILLHTIFEIL